MRLLALGLSLIAAPAAVAAYPGADGRIVLTCDPCAGLGVGRASGVVTLSRDGRQADRVDGMRSTWSWSPDGRWLVGWPATFDRGLWLASADGTAQRRLTDPGTGYDSLATFSRDGSRVAFVRATGSRTDLYVLALDGSEPVRVVEDFAGYDLAWSPASNELAFTTTSDDDRAPAIAVVDPADGRVREVARGWRIDGRGRIVGSGSYSTPEWAPGGDRLAVLRWRGQGDGALVIMRPDGRGRRILARGLSTSGGLAWAPSGRSILAMRSRRTSPTRNGVYDLVEIRIADGRERTLRRGFTYAHNIDWQPRPREDGA